MKLTPFLLLAAPLAACTSPVGDDHSRVGDLLEGDALGLQLDTGWYGTASLDIGLYNTTQDGACQGLSADLTATINGVAATVTPGGVDEEDGWSKPYCPSVQFSGVDKLGDVLDVVITDNSRPAGDPYRSVSLSFPNPSVGNVTWDGSTDDALVHTVHAGDRIRLQVPTGVVVDDAAWDLAPAPTCTWSGNAETCTVYIAIAQGQATVAPGELDIDVPANASGAEVLHVDPDFHVHVSGCAHATCNDMSMYDEGAFSLDVQ